MNLPPCPSPQPGRKPLLIVCYLATLVGLVILASAQILWHFGVATALQIIISASIGVGSALVTDLGPQDALGTALSWFTATNWIGYSIGFAITGVAIKTFGMATTMIMGMLLALIAVVLLIPIRRPLLNSVAIPG